MNELSAAHDEPVDITAARVTRFRGERWEQPVDPFVATNRERVQACLAQPLRLPIDAPNLRGRRAGRMTVVCYGFSRRGAMRGKGCVRYWVCRCDCGEHEFRTAKSINRAAPGNQCDRCSRAQYARNLASFQEHGRNLPAIT